MPRYVMRPIVSQVCADRWCGSQDAARPHSAAHLGENSIATAQWYVWQPMHATHTLYYSVVPEPVLVAEAATQRAVKAAENLSADLVEVANSGAAKVSLEPGQLRVLTVRPPVVAR